MMKAPHLRFLLAAFAYLGWLVGAIEILDGLLIAKAPMCIMWLFALGWSALGFFLLERVERAFGKLRPRCDPNASNKAALREDIFKRIEAERERQIAKWGDQSSRPDGDWALILGEEVGEWMRACLDGDKRHAVEEMTQVLAVGTAWLEGRIEK